jgi:hypothetical protein
MPYLGEKLTSDRKKDLEQCFPLISAAHPGTMKEVWEDTAKALQAEILVRIPFASATIKLYTISNTVESR